MSNAAASSSHSPPIRNMNEDSDSSDTYDSELDETSEADVATDDLNAIEAVTEVPKDIPASTLIIDVCMHPKRNLVASGTIEGPINLHSYAPGENANRHLISYDHRKNPCRALRFSDSGDYLFTGCQDSYIYVMDMEKNSELRHFSRQDGSAIYSILPVDNFILATGEDDGVVALWDFRMQAPIQCFEDCEDYISSLVVNNEKKILLATCGEGRLMSYNVKSKKLIMQSEDYDCDLLCAGIFKGGSKVAVGAGDGSLNIFNWNEFGNISDRFPGHPGPVNSISVLSDDIVCTGCDDGKVRVVQLFPNRFLGVLGGHNGLAVEKTSISFDSTLLASISHDNKIKFWDLTSINDLKEEDVKDTKKKHKQVNKQLTDFYADM